MDLKTISNWIQQQKGKKALLERNKKETEKELLFYENKEINIRQAQLIIQLVAKQTQEEIQMHIVPLVSHALNIIYDDPYEFNLEFVEKRGKTEARPVFIRNEKRYFPGKETGLGPVDIASLGLRLSLWCLNKNTISNTIILDEPFKFVDEYALPNTAELIKQLSKKLGIQFLIIVCNKKHNDQLISIADKVIEIKKGDME